MKSNIASLYPSIYRGVLETDILSDVQDIQHDELFQHMDEARRNQFVLTADQRGIEVFERIYLIRATPSTEDLEFRRQRILLRMRTMPPFTMRWLRERLDDIIGPGQYTASLLMGAYNYVLGSWQLGKGAFQQPSFTLEVSATTSDSAWYQEVHVFVERVKPANIVYILNPLLVAGISISETIYTRRTQWNYRLNGGWRLGQKPFSYPDQNPEVIKMPSTSSLQSDFLADHAAFTVEDISSVLINDTVSVSYFLDKEVAGSDAVLRYTLPDGSDITEITNIKLMRDDGTVLSSAPVFIPVTTGMSIQHIIKHREDGING